MESQQDQQAQDEELSASLKGAVATNRARNVQVDAEKSRKLQALQLQRERVLSERTSNPHRRSALATALVDIEEKLAELGWTVHL